MKILVIGDIHGRRNWEQVVESTEYDHLVFLGDYTDHWTYTNVEILHSLNQVIRYKVQSPDKVTLLIGNHDFQYIYGSIFDHSYTCSGFRPTMFFDLWDTFRINDPYFKMVHKIGPYLFSHAGITNKWWNMNKAKFQEVYQKYNNEVCNDMVEFINFAHHARQADLFWQIGPARGGMRYDAGSCIWADQQETRFGSIRGYHHVVGHTPVSDIKTYELKAETSITYCDCMDKLDKGYEIVYIETE